MSTDLDRRVSEIVGWPMEVVRGVDQFGDAIGRWPTTSTLDAIAALEAMREKGWHHCILYMQRGEYTMVLHSDKPRGYGRETVSGVAETLPLAICRAIVAAGGGEVMAHLAYMSCAEMDTEVTRLRAQLARLVTAVRVAWNEQYNGVEPGAVMFRLRAVLDEIDPLPTFEAVRGILREPEEKP